MFGQMAGLAMNRDRDFRSDPLIHGGQFVPARMTGNMDEVVFLGNDADAALGKKVLQVEDRGFVSRDDAGGEDATVSVTAQDATVAFFMCE